MSDDGSWYDTTWAGSRRVQREAFRALAFREKMERVEQMADLAKAISQRADDRGSSHLADLWAKTSTLGDHRWHPLILHLLDVAAAALAILDREPESTRRRMGAVLGLPWADAKPWLLFVIACHDLGKACPGFQSKWTDLLTSAQLKLPRLPDLRVRHNFVSQVALAEILRSNGWPEDLAELTSEAIGCHHGERASEHQKDRAHNEIRGHRNDVTTDWMNARGQLVDALIQVLGPGPAPTKSSLTGPDFMLLAGLTSFADWIGSNEEWFTFGTPDDCADLSGWFERRRAIAERELTAIGWTERTPLTPEARDFRSIFNFAPRPLQQAVTDLLPEVDEPAVILVEAPMGEGKTEAAFFAHLELQRRFGHRGMYVALPTKATGDAMFARTLGFLKDCRSDRHLDLQLLHGAKWLNDDFQHLRFSTIDDGRPGAEVRAAEWFTNKKRALLSEYGVGTVDQALVPILPVRHHFVRLWGLANRVVILDEIHAYDAYTGTLLLHLVSWLQALGSSVILLSATLSPSIRRSLAKATGSHLPTEEAPYPRLSLFVRGREAEQRSFAADPARRLTVRVRPIATELGAMRLVLDEQLVHGGMGLALVNTVDRAQKLYLEFPEGEPEIRGGVRIGKRLSDGTIVLLFHARFPADQREAREKAVLGRFGPDGTRTGRCILIATQVAEQSLDLDFDVIVTDLAPIDLVLQRAGRLWRHERSDRPLPAPILFVAGLDVESPPGFQKPLWWGKVYREDLLLRTWCLLRATTTLMLPDDIDRLVTAGYEDQVEVPAELTERLASAEMEAEGKDIAQRTQAHMAIIGFPDDASWKDPGRFVLYDEDEPGVHRTLMAQTRLGEDSVVAIPIFPGDHFQSEDTPDSTSARQWFLRGVSLSRPGVVAELRRAGVPPGWEKSPLLRNCMPLPLDAQHRWVRDPRVCLDDDLGVVYESKEAA